MTTRTIALLSAATLFSSLFIGAAVSIKNGAADPISQNLAVVLNIQSSLS